MSLLSAASAFAISSTNYIIDEDFVGGGGTVDSSSPSYSAQDSIGATAVGDSESANNRLQSGATTTDDPMLEFSVSTTSVSLGALMTSLTRTGTASFSVRNYTSSGYVVQVIGAPPSNGSHTLTNMASSAASSQGTEQFGINVVANTSPETFGSNPVQVPSADFSFGTAASGYDTANAFKYNSGDTIALATESSGQTDYTMAYITNISTATPGGNYTGTQTLVCTGTY
jgi:hypothetical protein